MRAHPRRPLLSLFLALASGCVSNVYVRGRARKANEAAVEARRYLADCLQANRRHLTRCLKKPDECTGSATDCAECDESCNGAKKKMNEVSEFCDELEHRAH